MAVIEIQTIEGGLLEWVGVYRDLDKDRAVRWVDALLYGAYRAGINPPNFRILDKPLYQGGRVIYPRQPEKYEEKE